MMNKAFTLVMVLFVAVIAAALAGESSQQSCTAPKDSKLSLSSMFPAAYIDPFGLDWLMDDPFRDSFFGNMKTSTGLDMAKAISPLMSVDLMEKDDSYQVLADLPGVDVKDLEVHVEGQSLIMKAERKHVHQADTDKVHRLERSYGSVQRRMQLPKNADLSNAATKFNNGVLSVSVPKLVQLPPASRKLEINSQ